MLNIVLIIIINDKDQTYRWYYMDTQTNMLHSDLQDREMDS